MVSLLVLLVSQVSADVVENVTENPCDVGFVDFESGTEGAVIQSTIPGLQFTTTAGQDWLYLDWRTGSYNGPYPSGLYYSNGNFCAWLGVSQGSGRIDFTEGTATYFSCLVSTVSGVVIDAYDSSDTLIATSGWAGDNLNTGKMTRLDVSAPGMAYVIVHDSGNYWLLDDICTDASGVDQPTAEAPALTPLGLIALVGVLSGIAVLTMRRKRR
jgi:hypothetical protein